MVHRMLRAVNYLALWLCCTTLHLSVQSQIVSVLYPPVQTNWGTWGDFDLCPTGQFVNGFKIRVESPQGRGDDTALNDVEMYCDDANQPNGWQYPIRSKGLHWGTWQLVRRCPGGFFSGLQLRSERPQGKGDDTALNDIRMRCNGNGIWYGGGGTDWGDWGEARECPSDSAICGFRTLVEDPQGKGDDTAVNSVEVKCCRL